MSKPLYLETPTKNFPASKTIYLFKEHRDFQVGKTKLNRRAVCSATKLEIVALIAKSMVPICLFAYSIYQAWSISPVFLPFAFLGIIWLLYAYKLTKTKQFELEKYYQLQNATVIMKGAVTELFTYSHSYKFRISKTHYARFCFPKEDCGNRSMGLLSSDDARRWPKDIKVGDTLYVLYIDYKTYCVL